MDAPLCEIVTCVVVEDIVPDPLAAGDVDQVDRLLAAQHQAGAVLLAIE